MISANVPAIFLQIEVLLNELETEHIIKQHQTLHDKQNHFSRMARP